MTVVIYDSWGQRRKVLYVGGLVEVFEAEELTFKEMYFLTLDDRNTTLTLLGMFNHVHTCKLRNPDTNVCYFRIQ